MSQKLRGPKQCRNTQPSSHNPPRLPLYPPCVSFLRVTRRCASFVASVRLFVTGGLA